LAPLTATETAWSEPPASETDHSAGVGGFVVVVASALAAGLPGVLAPLVPVAAPVAPAGGTPVAACAPGAVVAAGPAPVWDDAVGSPAPVAVAGPVEVEAGGEADGAVEGALGAFGAVFVDGSVPDVDGEGVAADCGEVVVVPPGVGGVVESVVVVVVVGVVVGAVELVDEEAPVGSVPVEEGLVAVELEAVPAELAAGSGVVVDCGVESTVSDMLLNELVEESGAAVETPEVSAVGDDGSAGADDGSAGADDGSAGAVPVAAVEAAVGSEDGGVWSGDDEGCVEAELVWSGVVGDCPEAAEAGADEDGVPVEDADAGAGAGGAVVEADEDDGGLPKPGGS
jgi:hypothetical protein